MIIPSGFDESMADVRKRQKETALKTAKKLNSRIRHFISNLQENPSLNKEAVKEIMQTLLEFP